MYTYTYTLNAERAHDTHSEAIPRAVVKEPVAAAAVIDKYHDSETHACDD